MERTSERHPGLRAGGFNLGGLTRKKERNSPHERATWSHKKDSQTGGDGSGRVQLNWVTQKATKKPARSFLQRKKAFKISREKEVGGGAH